ncbi:hypothetical protein [Paractinoplanes lichenicola]|uniref:Uncharacterized protein n=1 Tax=Paractinoplanes lichenicola TaxID=2802976 RepID=A0ABS1VMK0_9ACTN|nr:hypothetical protein [Actinoplanes lichenicola]MBL7255875.1 hypothetical protein [Actinoplanes lichenicola]
MPRRPRPWAEAVSRYALPHLPGEWLVNDGGLIMRPVGLIARGITPQPSQPLVILHPLYLPLDVLDTGWKLGHELRLPEYFTSFRTVEDGEHYMARLVPALREVVLPWLEENGTLEGYLRRCRRVSAGQDVWHLFFQAATAVLLRRDADASADLATIQHIASLDLDDPYPSPWLPALAAQAAELRDRLLADPAGTRACLLAGVPEQRRRRGLPETDEDR